MLGQKKETGGTEETDRQLSIIWRISRMKQRPAGVECGSMEISSLTTRTLLLLLERLLVAVNKCNRR